MRCQNLPAAAHAFAGAILRVREVRGVINATVTDRRYKGGLFERTLQSCNGIMVLS